MTPDEIAAMEERWSPEAVANNGFDPAEALKDLRKCLVEIVRLRDGISTIRDSTTNFWIQQPLRNLLAGKDLGAWP